MTTVLISGAFMLAASLAAAADIPAAPQKPPYERSEALATLINPHEQINEEGEVIWGTCAVCHKNIPDIAKEKSIKDVSLHFDEDLNQICRRCHLVRPHPGAEGISATMSGFIAPDHLVAPPKGIINSIRLNLKDVPTILPLDPKTGKIICATCHNPHERGLLVGKADWGADSSMRLRSAGLDICQYCHRK